MEGGKGGVAKDSCNGLGGQVNEEASDKVLEVEQKYNEVRRPVYNKRNDIIHNIPDFWLTAVCVSGLKRPSSEPFVHQIFEPKNIFCESLLWLKVHHLVYRRINLIQLD